MKENVGRVNWNVAPKGWDVFWYVQYFSTPGLPAGDWIFLALRTMQTVYYPVLGIIGVPVNLVTIGILSRGKCGLSKGVTYYLVAMAGADLLVIIFDVILRQIPIFYAEWFSFLWYVPICNLHAVFLYAVTDCSVWFTVAFTFDRLLAICFQKIKTRYCNQKTASVVLGTVTGLSCLKNIFWYFMFTGEYYLDNDPWFCIERTGVLYSQAWATVEFLHYFLTPVAAFVLILLFNVITIRHILVASRARGRLRAPDCQGGSKDPEMASRRKSVILLLVISANFIILWTSFMIYSIWIRLWWMQYITVMLHRCVQELGYVLQLLSCCTNTGIYAVTQKKFRAEFKNLVTFPFIKIATLIKRREQALQNSLA